MILLVPSKRRRDGDEGRQDFLSRSHLPQRRKSSASLAEKRKSEVWLSKVRKGLRIMQNPRTTDLSDQRQFPIDNEYLVRLTDHGSSIASSGVY
jgi:hypothetical protein